jgi:hypothetical protein
MQINTIVHYSSLLKQNNKKNQAGEVMLTTNAQHKIQIKKLDI